MPNALQSRPRIGEQVVVCRVSSFDDIRVVALITDMLESFFALETYYGYDCEYDLE
jgi:hypothetical protein